MGFLEERDLSDAPSIPEFYKGKTIFITGGTGFMGKVLIEKLLYSCSELDRIYLLMRSKKGVAPEDRLAQLYSSLCFKRLKKEKPTLFKTKVFIISGDIMEAGLGLSVEDRALLVNRVNILFHAAASVRFDDPLRYAVQLNLKGTLQVMDLAKEMRRLCVVVHVSTSYCNTGYETIEEVIYPPVADWRDTLQVCESLDDHTINCFTAKYMGGFPNTYTFTKNLSEHVVYEAKGQLPVIIVRPAIVVSSFDEPESGWIENFNGPVGINIPVGKGVLRVLFARPEIKFDYIPVDVSIRSIVTAAWLRGIKTLEPTDDIPVYHSCMDPDDRFTMEDSLNLGLKALLVAPLDNAIWVPRAVATTSSISYYIRLFFLQLVPALFVDTLLWLLGKKPMLLKIQRKIYAANLALSYFMMNDWTFMNTNLVQLRSCIKDEDREQFYYTLRFADKHKYYINCCFGARKFLLNEKEEHVLRARRHNKRILVVETILKFLFYGYLLRFIYLTVLQLIW